MRGVVLYSIYKGEEEGENEVKRVCSKVKEVFSCAMWQSECGWFGLKRVSGRSKRLGGVGSLHSVRRIMEESKVSRTRYSTARCPICPPIF